MAIGVGAFCAGEMVFHFNKKEEKSKTISDMLLEARVKNNEIVKMAPRIEDSELVNTIKEINTTVSKIINTIEKKPEKFKGKNNFFNYYLPVTVNIINRYDDIENQKLSSEDSKKFMESTKQMLSKINDAFKNYLSSLYQDDMSDTDAEMKVFESMLKMEGLNGKNDFNIKGGK